MAHPSDSRIRASRIGAIGFTLCAVLLATATAWLIMRMLSAGGYTSEPTRPVIVALRELQAGRPLVAADLKVVPWPSSSVPPGAFSETRPLLEPLPRVPTGGFNTGEPILAQRLASPRAGPGLAALVSPGARAVAIALDKDVAAARLLYPGAVVDVLATIRDPIERVVSTRTVIEGVRVLAVGTFADIEAVRRGRDRADAEGGATGYSPGKNDAVEAVVTLEVTPRDAERLSLATREGKIDLALRNATDKSPADTHGVTSAELIGGAGQAEAVAAVASGARSSGSDSSDDGESRRSKKSRGRSRSSESDESAGKAKIQISNSGASGEGAGIEVRRVPQ